MHRWLDDDRLEVDGSVFRLMQSATGADDLPLLKSRRLVERYLAVADEFRGGRVFEAGVFRGGSTAFFAALLTPEKLTAIDLHPERNAWLDDWLADREQDHAVRLHHGVDQADRGRITHLLSEEFDDQPLDLVVDDASHLLTPTLATFEVLFPRLRPGGLYVIEDWSWNLVLRRSMGLHPENLAEVLAQRPELLDEGASAARLEDEMWRVVLRLTMALGAHVELVPEMEVTRGFAAFRRGPADLDPDGFVLDEWVGDSPV